MQRVLAKLIGFDLGIQTMTQEIELVLLEASSRICVKYVSGLKRDVTTANIAINLESLEKKLKLFKIILLTKGLYRHPHGCVK